MNNGGKILPEQLEESSGHSLKVYWRCRFRRKIGVRSILALNV